MKIFSILVATIDSSIPMPARPVFVGRPGPPPTVFPVYIPCSAIGGNVQCQDANPKLYAPKQRNGESLSCKNDISCRSPILNIN